jgi:nitronate monooxygenase
MKTRLTEALGLVHPIVSAPMALVSGGRLASAVSRAGGLGLVGGGFAGVLGGEPDLAAELDLARGEKFGVGFITWALARAPAGLELGLAAGPVAAVLSFGDPFPFAGRIRAAGAMLICQVQNLTHVDRALEAGAGAIVAQGTEAGGHGARRSTLPFVPEVADYLARRSPDTLLLAAGGIADGRGLAAALMLGADGVVMGTRFWSSAEALTPTAATDRALGATGDDTVRTRAIDRIRGLDWPDYYSSRMVRNRLTDQWADREGEAAQVRGSFAREYQAARERDDFDLAAIVAGEAVGLIHDRPGAGEIVERVVAEAEELLGGAARRYGVVTADRG